MNSTASFSRADLVEQLQHLLLHRDVERRDRLVGDQQLGLQRQRAGDADALALAAGELVRIAVERVGIEPTQSPSACARFRQRFALARPNSSGPRRSNRRRSSAG
jgi:hypothetical protein